MINTAIFREVVKIKDGETAFETVKRFKILEARKNAAGRALINAYEKCRAARA